MIAPPDRSDDDPGATSDQDTGHLSLRIAAVAVLPSALLVGAPALLSLLLANRGGSDINDITWAFYAVPVGAIVGAAWSWHTAARLPSPRARSAAALLGVTAAAAAFVLGFGIWAEAADIACHGGYECPF